jgi:Rap1a immunity proteins
MLSGKLRKRLGVRMRRVVLAIGLAMFASSAGASFDSGNDLYKFCTAKDEFSSGMCLGLISGYFDEMHVAYKCTRESSEITRGQLKDIVVQALRDQPAKRHMPGFVLASAAFMDAFGCESWVGSGPQKK